MERTSFDLQTANYS